jgi:hypothetical protein
MDPITATAAAALRAADLQLAAATRPPEQVPTAAVDAAAVISASVLASGLHRANVAVIRTAHEVYRDATTIAASTKSRR